MGKGGGAAARGLKGESDRTTKKSRYFSSLFVLYLFTRRRGDGSARGNFSPHPSPSAALIPSRPRLSSCCRGKRCPSTPKARTRTAGRNSREISPRAHSRVLHEASERTALPNASHAIASSNLPIGIPSPTVMVVAVAEVDRAQGKKEGTGTRRAEETASR